MSNKTKAIIAGLVISVLAAVVVYVNFVASGNPNVSAEDVAAANAATEAVEKNLEANPPPKMPELPAERPTGGRAVIQN